MLLGPPHQVDVEKMGWKGGGGTLKLSLSPLLTLSMLSPMDRGLATVGQSCTPFRVSIWTNKSGHKSRGSS